VFLANKFVERARAHAVGQRARAFALLLGKGLKEAHRRTLPLTNTDHTDLHRSRQEQIFIADERRSLILSLRSKPLDGLALQ
jgi:hypothetical protein